MDWTDCPLVEVVPGKVSGVPLLEDTRLPSATVLSDYEAASPVEEIANNFDMPEQTIRDLLTYAVNSRKQRPMLRKPFLISNEQRTTFRLYRVRSQLWVAPT